MSSRVSSGLTACVALAGASVIAMTPVMSSAPTPPRIVEAAADLMATASFAGMNQAELVAEFGKRLAEQGAQAPLLPLVLAAQLAHADNTRLFSQIRQIVDSPVYVVDPLIEAIADTVPPQLGGGSDNSPDGQNPSGGVEDGAIMQFRNNELLGLRDAINAQFADALDVDRPWLNENYAAELAAGMLESAERAATGTALGAVGVVSIAQAVAEGNNVALYTAIRSYTDAPLWVADPTIEGLAEALPTALGGGTDHDFTKQDPRDGALMRFRNERLWTATRDTRVAIAHALNVPVTANGDVDTDGGSSSLRAGTGSKASSTTTLKAQLNDAKGKAKERRANARANVKDTVKKVKAAVKNASKSLKPKASED